MSRRYYLVVFLCVFFHNILLADGAQPWESKPFEADAATMYKAAGQVNAPAGTDAIVFMDEERYTFDTEGRAVHTQYTVYKVLTQQGADDWADLSLSWEPWHEDRPEIVARVITPDFAVHALDSKTITDAPAREEDDSIYSDRRVLRAPLPAIAPGSLVEETEISRESAAIFGAGIVGRSFFGRIVPVQHARLILDAPTSLPLRFVARALPDMKPQRTEKDGRVQIVFDAGPLDPLESEGKDLPSDAPVYPEVVFSTGDSWQRMAEAYAKIVDSRIAGTEVKPLVAKLIAGKLTREDKAAAILRYLDREVRYTGVEFGDAAIIPRSPTETLKEKYGDCKDKATLLVAMLRAAGIPANVALLNGGDREDVIADLPGMGLFDHAIVYVPGSPEIWIDATDEYARLGELPSGDQGRLALIASAGSQALTPTPVSSSQDNALIEQREFYLTENGPARVVEISEPHGSLESEYRGYYADKESKDRKNRLTEYMKSQYLADSLDSFTRSDPSDISSQFQLRLEASKAHRGYTELDNAEAAIRLDSLFSRLPSELQTREKDISKEAQTPGNKPKKKRTADYELEEPFVTEWRYTIVPPPGFLPKPLPENEKLTAGPATLTKEFSTDGNGTIHAVLRFDTVKRRFTIAEADAMRNQIDQWRNGQAIFVSFEPVAQKLLREGKVRESLQAYRDLIALHPKEALHHVQMAEALLNAGLGEGARQQARLAVKLEPNSVLAQKMLADVLEHDLVGRKFRPGSDLADATTALRAAVKLDPDDKYAAGNLAVVLEYNSEGERYGKNANLKEAITQYRRIKSEDLTEVGMQNNLAFDLIYAGMFDDAEKYARTLNPPLSSIIVAAVAMQHDAHAGIAEANKLSEDEASRKRSLRTAGEIAMNLRRYPIAADLMEASAGDENTSRTMALASMLRKSQLHENVHYSDDPAGISLQFFLAAIEGKLTPANLDQWLSRNGLKVLQNSNQDAMRSFLKSQKLNTRSSGYLPKDVIIDITMQLIHPTVEGDDAGGYRVKLASNAKSITLYIVREDGKYKILDSQEDLNAIGLEILDRLAAGNTSGARILLDWIREELHLGGGDDPLSGSAFPRLWAKGKDATPEQIRLAAAAILVQAKATASQGVSILEAGRNQSSSDIEKVNISLALLLGYSELEQYDKFLAVASELAKQYPESRRAFLDQELCLRALGRNQEADTLAQERLLRIPGDIDALHAKIRNAIQRHDYSLACTLDQNIIDSGKADAEDYNELAWHALFAGNSGNTAIENAIKATQLKQNSAAILHTLGSAYADAGKTKEAREVLIQAMDILNLDEPNSDYWYAFGRIAEQYGERELAIADYKRVEKPQKTISIPESSYWLAQQRLKTLESSNAIAASKFSQ